MFHFVEVESVRDLIASIIPPGKEDQIKTKFNYNWDKQSTPSRKRKKCKKSTKDKLVKDLTLPRVGLSYVEMLPVNAMWQKYMEGLLSEYLGKEVPTPCDTTYENFR